MTTHAELQHRLPTNAPQRDRVLTTLHYFSVYEGLSSMTMREITDAMIKARVPKARTMNVSAVLIGLVPRVEQLDETRNGGRLYTLTETGREYLRDSLGLAGPPPRRATGATTPAATPGAAMLETLGARVSDDDVRDYLEEATRCLRAGARRAAVVFVWIGAIHTLRGQVWELGTPTIDAAIKKHRPKLSFTKEGDFADINDDLLLQVAQDLEVIDKSEKKQLKHALDLRNDCGHPAKYKPRENRVSAFIEDVIGIVWK